MSPRVIFITFLLRIRLYEEGKGGRSRSRSRYLSPGFILFLPKIFTDVRVAQVSVAVPPAEEGPGLAVQEQEQVPLQVQVQGQVG